MSSAARTLSSGTPPAQAPDLLHPATIDGLLPPLADNNVNDKSPSLTSPSSPLYVRRRHTRRRLNLSQAQFARLLGVHRSAVWRWESPLAAARPRIEALEQAVLR